jgi:hypothetical protein
MLREWVFTLNLISQAAGLVSVLALYYAGIGVPWDKQSWKGVTEFEVQRRQRQYWSAWVGIPCTFIAVGCQTAITLWG